MLREKTSDPRQRLKHATANAHASLENFIGPLHDRPAYERYLRGIHAFRTSVEDWLSGASFDSGWQGQRLSDELALDLEDIGAPPLARPIAFRPAAGGAAFMLGVHYVLEGSALGARLLCKQVEPLGFTHVHGARHLWAQAASLESWRAFVALLQRRGPDQFDDVAAGAEVTFNTAAAAMREASHG